MCACRGFAGSARPMAAGRHLLPPEVAWPADTDSLPGIGGIVALAPGSDLVDCRRRGSGHGAADLLGGGPEQHPQRYAVADPARLNPLGVWVRIVHGVADDRVRWDMSRSDAARAYPRR